MLGLGALIEIFNRYISSYVSYTQYICRRAGRLLRSVSRGVKALISKAKCLYLVVAHLKYLIFAGKNI